MPSPTPLTEEQLNLMTEQTRHAVHHAMWRWRTGAVVGFVILVLAIAGAFWANAHDQTAANRAIVRSGTVVAVDACNRDFRSRQGDISLFQRLEASTKINFKAGRMTPEQYAEALKFYRHEIAKRPLPDCRKAARAITDDPGADRAPLHPLYPRPKPRPDK